MITTPALNILSSFSNEATYICFPRNTDLPGELQSPPPSAGHLGALLRARPAPPSTTQHCLTSPGWKRTGRGLANVSYRSTPTCSHRARLRLTVQLQQACGRGSRHRASVVTPSPGPQAAPPCRLVAGDQEHKSRGTLRGAEVRGRTGATRCSGDLARAPWSQGTTVRPVENAPARPEALTASSSCLSASHHHNPTSNERRVLTGESKRKHQKPPGGWGCRMARERPPFLL